jgi:hypothetical protein
LFKMSRCLKGVQGNCRVEVPCLLTFNGGVCCRDVTSLLSGGLLTEDFTSKTMRSPSESLFCTGEAPTMAWMQFPTLRRKSLQQKLEISEGSNMMSSVLQMATHWAAQSVVGIANASDGVQGTVLPFSAEATWVIVGVLSFSLGQDEHSLCKSARTALCCRRPLHADVGYVT